MKERLLLFIEYLDISIRKFENIVGLSNSFVSNIGDSIREISKNKIIAKYPELNINWLLTGEGEMLNNTDNKINDNIPHDHQENSPNYADDMETTFERILSIIENKDKQLNVLLAQNSDFIKQQDKLISQQDKLIDFITNYSLNESEKKGGQKNIAS